jgi:hypothetical protein
MSSKIILALAKAGFEAGHAVPAPQEGIGPAKDRTTATLGAIYKQEEIHSTTLTPSLGSWSPARHIVKES